MGRDKKPELSSKPEKKDPKNDGVKITPSPKQASTSGTVNPAINHHNRAESVKTTGNSDVKIVGDQNMKDVVRELIDRNIALEVRSLAQQVAANNLTSRNYDSDDEDMSCGHWCEYVIVVVLSSILLVASLVLVLFWCLYYRKGYAWNDNLAQQFNLHPTLMITGFVFFSGFSMLLYRISRCCRRIYVKLLHTLFHTLAIPCVVLGFMAVLDFHNLADPPIPNFYSIHSWMGFVTMGSSLFSSWWASSVSCCFCAATALLLASEPLWSPFTPHSASPPSCWPLPPASPVSLRKPTPVWVRTASAKKRS
uniref:Cytochrome b reductase 1 n=1 Tax=Lygus hesperus TaxID=30085 RepID=A0A0A9YHE3_LYGHE